MKLQARLLFIVLTLNSPGWALLQLGDQVTQDNLSQATHLLPQSAQWMVEHGMRINIIKTKPVSLPRAYREATHTYAAEVQLSAHGRELVNYVAGLPFPDIDLSDPLAGTQIMWNVQLPPMDNFGTTFGIAFINRKGSVEQTYANPTRWMKGIGRLYLTPKPSVPHNPLLLATAVLGPTLVYRYLSPDMLDAAYIHHPAWPQPFFVPHVDWSQTVNGSDFDLESTFGFSGKLEDWTFRVIAERDMLAVVHSGKYGDPSQWCAPRDGTQGIVAALPCVSWEKRRVWVVEGIPNSAAQHAYSKRFFYVDQDFFGIVLMEMYDHAGVLWKAYLPCLYYTKRPHPNYPNHPQQGARYHYTDEWPFLPNGVVIDMQKQHATTFESPPSHQPPSKWQHEMYFNEPVPHTLSQSHWLEFMSHSHHKRGRRDQ